MGGSASTILMTVPLGAMIWRDPFATMSGVLHKSRIVPASPPVPLSRRKRKPYPATTATSGESAGKTATRQKPSVLVKKARVASRSAQGSTISALCTQSIERGEFIVMDIRKLYGHKLSRLET